MSETNAVATVEKGLAMFAIDAEAMVKQDAMIQEMMKSIMKEDTHFGKIPGCGPKPALLQPGAQKLCTRFQVHVEVKERVQTDMADGHREVRFDVLLKTNVDGLVIAEGVGTCSTMETKYRYRRGSGDVVTDRMVPKAFWDLAKDKQRGPEGKALLGGPRCGIKKVDGKWMVIERNAQEREEHPDPADYYNTVEKISFKRAQLHAVINGTACSDIFEQDFDYLKDLMEIDGVIDVNGTYYEPAGTGSQPQPVQDELIEKDQATGKEKPATEVTEEPPPVDDGKIKPLGVLNVELGDKPAHTEGQPYSKEYAEFIVKAYHVNVEQTVTLEMLEEYCGEKAEKGWSAEMYTDIMKLFAMLKTKKTTLAEAFPNFY